MLAGSNHCYRPKPSNFKCCSAALAALGACILGAHHLWLHGFTGESALWTDLSAAAVVPAHASARESCRMAAWPAPNDAVDRQFQEARREAKRARRSYADALRRSNALTLAGLSLGHRRQLLRMLRISEGNCDATVTCIHHASNPPPWSGMSSAQKRLRSGQIRRRDGVQQGRETVSSQKSLAITIPVNQILDLPRSEW